MLRLVTRAQGPVPEADIQGRPWMVFYALSPTTAFAGPGWVVTQKQSYTAFLTSGPLAFSTAS